MELPFDHYLIRIVTEADLMQYFDLIGRNRKRLEDFFAGTVAVTRTLDDTKQHLNDVIEKAAKNLYFPLVVVDQEKGQIIGSIQIKNIDWNAAKGELGYYIDAAYEGRGIIRRAVALIIRHGFEHLGFNKFYIRTHQDNIPSRRVAEKNGFSLEGNLRAEYRTTSGELVDLMYYGLLHPVPEKSR